MSPGYFHLYFSFGQFLALLLPAALKEPRAFLCHLQPLSISHMAAQTGLLTAKPCPFPGSTLNPLAKLLGNTKVWSLYNQLNQTFISSSADSAVQLCLGSGHFFLFLSFFTRTCLSVYHSSKPYFLLRKNTQLGTMGAGK